MISECLIHYALFLSSSLFLYNLTQILLTQNSYIFSFSSFFWLVELSLSYPPLKTVLTCDIRLPRAFTIFLNLRSWNLPVFSASGETMASLMQHAIVVTRCWYNSILRPIHAMKITLQNTSLKTIILLKFLSTVKQEVLWKQMLLKQINVALKFSVIFCARNAFVQNLLSLIVGFKQQNPKEF